MINFNDEVTKFLDEQNHPLRHVIEELRQIILGSNDHLAENIKWNAPNYLYDGEDRVTLKIQPPKQTQIIFHRGAKKLAQPKKKLINDESGLLLWKENDRAIASFKSLEDVKKSANSLKHIINDWVIAAKPK